METGRCGTVFAPRQLGTGRYRVDITRPGATGRLAGPTADPAHGHRNPSGRPRWTPSPPRSPPRTIPAFWRPSGHVVDPDGPSGHVEGLARPVVPQTVSSGPELAVATPAVAGQHRGTAPALADHAIRRQRAGSGTGAPPRCGVVAAGTAGRSHRRPAGAPTQQHHLLLGAAPTAFTSAPEQDTATPRPVVSDLPVVSSATSSSMPTVSRHVADPEAEHARIQAPTTPITITRANVHADHDHSGHDHSGESGGADAESAGSSSSGHDVAPLLGDSAAAAGHSTAAGQDHRPPRRESTAAAMGLAAHVQRSAAGPAPTRSPGLGAPLTTSGSSSFSSSTPPLPASQQRNMPTIGSSDGARRRLIDPDDTGRPGERYVIAAKGSRIAARSRSAQRSRPAGRGTGAAVGRLERRDHAQSRWSRPTPTPPPVIRRTQAEVTRPRTHRCSGCQR